jgi:hypothetical protein
MELALITILVIANLTLIGVNVHLVKVLMAQSEARLLRKLRKYRSTKLGRLYRKAIGKKAGDVLAFPNQHYINQTLVA